MLSNGGKGADCGGIRPGVTSATASLNRLTRKARGRLGRGIARRDCATACCKVSATPSGGLAAQGPFKEHINLIGTYGWICRISARYGRSTERDLTSGLLCDQLPLRSLILSVSILLLKRHCSRSSPHGALHSRPSPRAAAWRDTHLSTRSRRRHGMAAFSILTLHRDISEQQWPKKWLRETQPRRHNAAEGPETSHRIRHPSPSATARLFAGPTRLLPSNGDSPPFSTDSR